MNSPLALDRFLAAQEPVYEDVIAELRAGRKQTHWMWFIFPQLEGLGTSDNARLYALRSVDEAAQYLRHFILGSRLRECVKLVNQIDRGTASDIFGSPDDLKFRSSLTLFTLAAWRLAAPGNDLFHDALDKYYDGRFDPRTMKLLGVGLSGEE